MENNTVQCNECDFKGQENDLCIIKESDGYEYFRACPRCDTDKNLMDINN